MSPDERFEKWASQQFWLNEEYVRLGHISILKYPEILILAKAAWDARQPEIDSRDATLENVTNGTQKEIDRLEREKDGAYAERDRLVAALSKVYPSHLCRHDAGEEWEDDWRFILCIHLPTGQATWHIHDSELPWFGHLGWDSAHWDGHTTEQKYERLAALENADRG
jgi:hypothetical protein